MTVSSPDKYMHLSNYSQAGFTVGRDMLKDGIADVLLIPVIVTTTDVQDFDFTIPITKSWYELYSKYTVNRATSVSYLVTWSPEVWAAFVLTTLLIALCVWTVTKIRSYTGTSDDEEVIRPNIISCIFVVWGSICSQGLQAGSTACSVRTATWVTLGFGLCMSTAYSAVLFSRLAVGKTEMAVSSLEAVAWSNTFSLCVRRESFGFLLFKVKETDPFIMEKWTNVVNRAPCPEQQAGNIKSVAKSVCQDNVLALETPMIMSKAMYDQDGCRVVSVAGRHAVAYVSFLMKKGFRHKASVNHILLRLLTTGVSNYLQKKWLSKEFPDSTWSGAEDISVTISHVDGLLVGFLLAVIVSFSVLLIERTVAKYNSFQLTKRRLNDRIVRSMGNRSRFY
ncbi:glutamate receptor ionotropic, kainate glr-3-like [Adelges cooleyi]|uniref:glutamate receptor ionotropic, kainate glr-3-like n=1 Tax=Adelges cooleyi TaxID=133065 RepID=UPI00217FE91C|nr:glutamate receptor ionotropic, kainate glr-3-like [Adelges cooleyi]